VILSVEGWKDQTVEEAYKGASDARHTPMSLWRLNRPIRHFGYI